MNCGGLTEHMALMPAENIEWWISKPRTQNSVSVSIAFMLYGRSVTWFGCLNGFGSFRVLTSLAHSPLRCGNSYCMAEYALMYLPSFHLSWLTLPLVGRPAIFATASSKPHCVSVVHEYRSQTSSLQSGNEFPRPSVRFISLQIRSRDRNMLISTPNQG